ncbi:MAG: hypothetical protein Q7T04_01600 [Dehalococcoidia bacterium]|nr:hypothetical protein [Dehalococcoidia bacterium]
MSKVVVKLFGNAEQAAQALASLKGKGYKAEEIGVLISVQTNATAFTREASLHNKLVRLDSMGTAVASGPLTELSKAKDVNAALAKLWGVAEETIDYYITGVAHGSVAISVHDSEDKLAEAKKILRAATAGPTETTKAYASSPAFSLTPRMAATNPVDAKMTGDFRKY